MNAKHVYLLYTYHEYGPENVRATLNPAALPEMLASLGGHVTARAEANLLEALRLAPEELAKGEHLALDDGWGGVTLQVVPLGDAGDFVEVPSS